MTQYYYLVASLPLLLFGDPPPFSSRAWLDMCREQVAEGDHALLSRISFDALDYPARRSRRVAGLFLMGNGPAQ